MSDLPRYLNELDEALFDLPDGADAMLLSEVDGYIAGLALLPMQLPPDQWLPAIWRPTGETPDYLYHDTELLETIASLARRHFDAVARDLHRGTYEPVYEVDTRNDDVLWEFWMAGFARAMDEHPGAFADIEEAPEDVVASLGGLYTLAVIARQMDEDDADAPDGAAAEAEEFADLDDDDEDAPLSAEDRRALEAEAPDLIPGWINTLYDWTRTRRPTPEFAIPVRKEQIGRNDPCPCGSGKKYKKCCGAAA
jgi:uncharacterized protein